MIFQDLTWTFDNNLLNVRYQTQTSTRYAWPRGYQEFRSTESNFLQPITNRQRWRVFIVFLSLMLLCCSHNIENCVISLFFSLFLKLFSVFLFSQLFDITKRKGPRRWKSTKRWNFCHIESDSKEARWAFRKIRVYNSYFHINKQISCPSSFLRKKERKKSQKIWWKVDDAEKKRSKKNKIEKRQLV